MKGVSLYKLHIVLPLFSLTVVYIGIPFCSDHFKWRKGHIFEKKSAWMLSIFSQHHSTQPMAPLASLRAKGFSGAMASQRNSKEA